MKKLKLLLKASWYVLREPITGFIGLVISLAVMGGIVYALSLVNNIENILFNIMIFLLMAGGSLVAVLIIWMIVDEYKALSKKEMD